MFLQTILQILVSKRSYPESDRGSLSSSERAK